MSLSTAAEFIELVKSGKYETHVNAKRGAGRSNLSESEKKKAFAFIDSWFSEEPTTANKKTAKKKAAEISAAPKKPGRKPKKKVTTRKASSEDGETEVSSISPSEIETTGEMLTLIDSTISKSESIVVALRKANEISETGDITEGVRLVKEALTGAAQLLKQEVIAPLNRTALAHGDTETANKLSQAVQSHTGVNSMPEAQLYQPSAPPAID